MTNHGDEPPEAAESAEAPERADADPERHATNLELFLDLVFVFAVTQIATLMAHDLTAAGVGRGVVIAWLVWWQWSQFTWAGAAVDLQREPWTRAFVLVTIPATLAMTVAIPESFHESGPWFGVAYLVVQLLVLGMQGATAIGADTTRTAFIKYAPVAAIAPVLVVIGGYLSGDGRLWLWVAAGVVGVAGALRGAAAGEWVINPVHFAERHATFVIISLGEVLVAIGASATETGLTWRTGLSLSIAAGAACVIWWTYFAFIPNVGEHALRREPGPHRGVVARDLFTFGHFPIIGGIVFFAVIAKHVVAHPSTPLPVAERWLAGLGVAMVLSGYLLIQWRVVRRLAPERFVAIAAIALLCAVGSTMDGVVLVAGVSLILAVMQAITWRRFRGDELAHVTANR